MRCTNPGEGTYPLLSFGEPISTLSGCIGARRTSKQESHYPSTALQISAFSRTAYLEDAASRIRLSPLETDFEPRWNGVNAL